MSLVDEIALKKNQFNKLIEQRDIIKEMDDHLMNLHESEESIQYNNKAVAKFLYLWLRLHSQKEEQTYQAKKCCYFYMWRYYQGSDIFEKNWCIEEQNLVKQKRYPFHKMKKQRQKIEEQIFDLERKNFFQLRQKQILSSVFKNAARRERLIKTIAFHRMIRNIALMHSNYNSIKQQQIVITQQDLQVQKENKTNKSRSKSPLPASNSRQTLQPSKQQALRIRAVFKMCLFLQKINHKDQISRASYFMRWFKIMCQIRQLEQIEEIESINVILSERVFREGIFRTKITLAKQELDSKVQMASQLLNQLLK